MFKLFCLLVVLAFAVTLAQAAPKGTVKKPTPNQKPTTNQKPPANQTPSPSQKPTASPTPTASPKPTSSPMSTSGSTSTSSQSSSANAMPTFTIDYQRYPQSAENICYSWHCTNGPRQVAPNRPAAGANRRANSCSGTNRCSTKKGHIAGYQCDEWPWAASSGGGANTATRCIPGADNGGSGSTWGAFVNNQGPQAPGRVLQDNVDFAEIKVVNIPNTGVTFCRGELPGGQITQQECANDDHAQPYLQQTG